MTGSIIMNRKASGFASFGETILKSTIAASNSWGAVNFPHEEIEKIVIITILLKKLRYV